MKEWNAPEVEEVMISNTQYGGKTVTTTDNSYVNDEGAWESTFVRENDPETNKLS